MSPAAQAARANIAAVSCLPCWNDWSVRFGASYDLFGTGNTALKVSVGKFLGQQALGLASSVNPLSGQTDARTWTDFDRNGTIFDATGNFQANEVDADRRATRTSGCLPAARSSTRTCRGRTTGRRAISVQHALFPRVSVTAGYYHRSFYNIQYTKNTLVNPDTDYTPFNITVPQNSASAQRRRAGDHDVQPESGQGQRRQQRRDVVREQHARLQRRGIQRERAVRQGLPVRRHHHRADGHRQLHRSQPNSNANNRRFCSYTPPFQTLYKASAVVHVAV